MPQDFQHSQNRRCKNHDYRSRCIYMITMLKSPAAPILSSISADPKAVKVSPIVSPSPAGMIINNCLRQLCRDYPALRILCRIIMPDHIHFELFVTERTELALGSMMAAFKSSCTNAYKKEFPHSRLALEKLSMFEPGFNDKIAWHAGVLVSPFINPEEKVWRDEAIRNGNGIILIVDYRFSDRKKPYKELFDLCAEGRLLIVSTEEFDTAPRTMRYAHARQLNALAASIAALAPRSATISRR